jgi:oxaloacetate decarboxylase gamma subunit
MTIAQMLEQSASLTVLGMGIVFSFLSILIFCVTMMGKIVQGLGLDKAKADSGAKAQVATDKAANAAVVAAISAAVTTHRR